jgi:hypothetical protein
MFSSVALVAVLAMTPAQGGGISLSGARVTYGELGAARADLKFLPGDVVFIGFDIDGIKADETGRVRYSMGMEVLNKDGAPIFKQEPLERQDLILLGGNKLPVRVYVNIGPDQAPGPYTCKVTVIDPSTKTTKSIEQKFDVLPKGFGVVQVTTTSDRKGDIPTPPLGVAGQQIYLQFMIIGFARDAKTKQPNVSIEFSVYTKDGAATLTKPVSLTFDRNVGPDDSGIPWHFDLPLNRVGDFTVELKLDDKVSKAPSKVLIPIKVVAVGN